MTVDLEAQTVTASDGQTFSFEVDPFRKHCLLNGLDDIGLTLEKAASIDSYRKDGRQRCVLGSDQTSTARCGVAVGAAPFSSRN